MSISSPPVTIRRSRGGDRGERPGIQGPPLPERHRQVGDGDAERGEPRRQLLPRPDARRRGRPGSPPAAKVTKIVSTETSKLIEEYVEHPVVRA